MALAVNTFRGSSAKTSCGAGVLSVSFRVQGAEATVIFPLVIKMPP